MELAVRHGLIGLMADHENPNLHDPAVALYSRLAARQGVMAHHLRRVLTELHAAGVRATVVKGLHLAHWAYGNPSHRTTTDVDLLVPAAEVERALEVLGADEAVQVIPNKTPKADKRHIPFVDESGVRFTLDLHWDLFSYTQLRGCADGATDWAWEQATFVEDHPLGPMWMLPEPARIAFLCTHALLDHRFRLILFRDLAEVARTDPDWAALIDFVRRWKLSNPTYLALLLAIGLADAAVPADVLAATRDPMASISYLERVLPQTDIVRFDGHRLHPLNLAAVLVHDDRRQRIRLTAGAPLAFPRWWKRIGSDQRRETGGGGEKSLLLLVSSNRRRGAEVFGERLANGLRDRGWQVDFVALENTGDSPTVSAVALADTVSGGRLDRHLVGLLRSRIARDRPAVVFANGAATLRYAVLATTGLRGKPKLAYASIGEPAFWLRHGRHRALQAALHSRVDLVLAVSAVTRDQLLELFRLRPDKVKVAHTGVPISFFEVPDKTQSDELRIVFLGNLSEEKGPDVALEAVTALNRQVPARLRFVGTGPLQEVLEGQTSSLGLSSRVEFTGSVADVRPHLAWADVLVLTSQTEGFPGVVLEAAAAATPAVAFDVGGTAETIVDGVTGIVVPPGNSEELVKALKALADDRDRIRDMGEAGRTRVRTGFLLDHAVDHHDQLLAEIVETSVLAPARIPS
jgi:glycosyltransferase involved in cell wall biosynthesis